jgi:hypothetical protein
MADYGFFGTLSEAKALRALAKSKGIDILILVCSGYHSKRVQVTFSMIFRGIATSLQVYTIDEKIDVVGLIIEYVKLLLYQNIVLPIEMKTFSMTNNVLI